MITEKSQNNIPPTVIGMLPRESAERFAAALGNGEIKGIQLAIAEAAENADHLVKAEDAIHMALARQ